MAAPTVGQGFVVTPSDLAYILKQIKIAEAHVANTTSATGPCGALVGTGPHQLSSPLLSFGLRTVDGSCNNLVPGRERIGAADELFPRLATADFKAAGPVPAGFGPPGTTTYAQTKGNVFDTEPRIVSNLIVDQTSTNPAAVAAAGFPVRTQGNPGVVPCTTDPDPLADPVVVEVPLGCTPSHQTLFIPNVTTDVGLSPPYNSLFTLFGQFFDHGVDQTVKGGSGTVFVPLKDDDPLVAGPNHVFGDADDLNPNLRFMVLTRGKNQPGADGVVGDNPATPIDESADDVRDTKNTDSPWVDQSQTYSSHASHQAFLREYVNNSAGRPVSTGKLLGGVFAGDGVDTGMATWATTKAQAADLLGLLLVDADVTNIPMLAVDPYGNFIPGPARGLPQYVTETGLVEGDTSAPVPVPSNVRYFDTPFLTDIAHSAAPTAAGPDSNDTAGNSLDTPSPAGTYDDELLDAHFIAGDGRVNENIGLTAIHQVFHSEHDRLIDDIKNTLTNDTSVSGVAALAQWKLDTGAPDAVNGAWNGERLFQAARFVTEMEYQHLVFEEFARKVQPAINPFEPFAFTQPDLNPAVRAEFAHAVYRFGHSMLTETISRRNADGTDNDISLLDGFLNPASYTDGGTAGTLNPQEAAGSIIMGMSDQIGNELDEFVTETLRNNLLGLPLDLATINMTRARSEGVPPLNVFRREVFGATNDGQLRPYSSWVDFGENLKHPASLVNFVAAYGQHPTILTDVGPDGELIDDPTTVEDETADNGPATLASRRTAARRLVNPVLGELHIPGDAAQFMNSVGAWSNDGTRSITGLDNVDLWVGGLAEITTPFGGLLGTTFNYVFENQMTDLQNGDRLYYLARTPGMNLRTQLEGNSFAELMMRNTSGTNTLKADSFATADCKFQLGNLAGTPAGFTASGNTVVDDPSTECAENLVLLRKPDGTIQYRQFNSVDPPGINGQSVYNGTDGPDRVWGGNDNDTFWGGPGSDVIEGGGGADVALGGLGDDIITDLAGDDVPKGGPGNDAIDAGPGLDIVMGGEGKDFTNGGANANETFGGDGDDFIYLGQSLDAAFGDSGNDWEEGGDQPDLMQGDSGNLFFLDDSQKPGSDILIGQGGDDDYDMEGGDDIGVGGSGIEKVAGASGFDWEIGQGEPQAQDMDLALPIPPLGILQVGVRDKFNEVEALSGWKFDDTLRGDDIVPSGVGGAGFIGCDVLDQAGLDRISGLDALVPPLATPLETVVTQSASQDCPILTGPNVWGDGNILLGGAGSDLIEGRGADDVIDGDAYLSVRLSVRTNPSDPASEIGSASIEGSLQSAMTSQYLRTSTGALTGPTLQQAVFAGTVDPGNIVAVREVLVGSGGTDTAVFSGPRADYDVTFGPDAITVTHARGTATDGQDRVSRVERLQFSDEVVNVSAPAAPVIGVATAGNASATVNWTAPVADGSPAVTGYEIVISDGTVITGIASTATSRVVNGLTNGTAYTFRVRASNVIGTGPLSDPSNSVTPTAPVGPQITSRTPGVNETGVAVNSNVDAIFDVPMAAAGFTTGTVVLRNPAGAIIAATVNYNGAARRMRLNPNANLAAGTVYTITLTGGPSAIRSLTGIPFTTTSWSFTTLAPPAPTVASSTPVPNATNVARGANLVVNFSPAVIGVSGTTFVLTDATTNAVIPGVLTTAAIAAGTRATLNPNGALARNTLYRVTLTGGPAAIRSAAAGTPFVSTSWTFTSAP
ncbi:peroxidase family protein [Nocardioides psychrotolerans]|uniref:peroxidase family protein n=1 Tax=Nocardioides psychrotolerans TaxID=1005945 RepID=UPI003137DBD8